MKWVRFLSYLLAAVLLSGCGELAYYSQCVTGHLHLMSRARPITAVLNDPETSPELHERLSRVLEIRNFASRELNLPENGSYRSYADLQRPYVVWNVVATPEFSVDPITWCFPVAGCVPYRGYYKEESARRFAEQLKEQGHDVQVYGVAAYSTLSWFNDPVLNTFSHREETSLAALIFHELAHQQVYVKNDSSFNEAFAVAVELEGVERWLEARGNSEQIEKYRKRFVREEEFVLLLLEMRSRLMQVYALPLDEDLMRSKKEETFELFRNDYAQLKERWDGYAGFDSWLNRPLNNAHFASVSTYRTLVPAFQSLLVRHGGNLKQFYTEAQRLADLPREERSLVLAHWLEKGREIPYLTVDAEFPESHPQF
ncbi:Predicted aminopeptidase [Geoalkalibacter ferrihydriticus]|uniref:Predicted aminopeptidase n=1 Tax=Geoalkalibacter ferrihydriticus TaxID=392333 RepID=A0A1G9QWZ5_9BACT|nr:aminopeptidase [Geoalkalibacter ferrihydriticus]SDM15391.1 Predicted aminopeptidase [Geoalkalibacter ferrihydriticus]